MNDYKHRHHGLVHNAIIYAGNSAPSPFGDDVFSQSDWIEKKVSDEMVMSYMCTNVGAFPNHPPIASSIMSVAFMQRQISANETKLVTQAFTKHGLFPGRTGSYGHNSYPCSIRDDETRAAMSPNAGPGTQSHHTYYRQNVKLAYLPAVWNLILDLQKVTRPRSLCMYSHIKYTDTVLRNINTSEQEVLALLTINFASLMHTDKRDCLQSKKNEMMKEIETITNNSEIERYFPEAVQSARCLLKLVEDFDHPTPTSCCSQYVVDEGVDAQFLQVHAYFPFPNSGVGFRILDRMTNTFLGSVSLHGSTVPVFYENVFGEEEIHIGEHPHVSLFVWGNKNKKNK